MPSLERLPDGNFIDWGRHWRSFGKQGEGAAKYYSGEAAEVLELLLKYKIEAK